LLELLEAMVVRGVGTPEGEVVAGARKKLPRDRKSVV
jgi:hypothetical protein